MTDYSEEIKNLKESLVGKILIRDYYGDSEIPHRRSCVFNTRCF